MKFNKFKIIAGSCSLEDYYETLSQTHYLQNKGINYQRAMLWKPRTTKQSFQGIGEEGLDILKKISKMFPKVIWVTEVMENEHVDILQASGLNFIYQIGTRNCQNFSLLKKLGSLENITILYKRGMSQTIDEYISATSYLEPSKNKIWLCLRGIRTFDDSMRNTPDIGAILVLKERFEYLDNSFEIIFDPSHATGDRIYVKKMSSIAALAGADGIEIEIHSNPDNAKSDANQTISFDEMDETIEDLIKLSKIGL